VSATLKLPSHSFHPALIGYSIACFVSTACISPRREPCSLFCSRPPSPSHPSRFFLLPTDFHPVRRLYHPGECFIIIISAHLRSYPLWWSALHFSLYGSHFNWHCSTRQSDAKNTTERLHLPVPHEFYPRLRLRSLSQMRMRFSH
jgi:hypothetical protein